MMKPNDKMYDDYNESPNIQLTGPAQFPILPDHLRVALLEDQGYAFAHDANGIDGVDQRLGWGVEEAGG
jgi:hypothetical protein